MDHLEHGEPSLRQVAELPTLAGLGTGEMFGFHFEELAILAPIFAPLGFVGLLSVSELTFEQVVKILEISIAIGIVHILLAYFLRLHADFKQGNKSMVFYHDIPTILRVLCGGSSDTLLSGQATTLSACLASQARPIQSQCRG